jgi:predicted transcriptional regulator
MTAKEQAVKVISQMPDEATIEDIMEEFYVRMKLDRGLAQLDAGEGIEHDEVKKRLAKWVD